MVCSYTYVEQPRTNFDKDLTEEMLSSLVKHLTGGYITEFTTQTGETYTVNWEKPWRRIDIVQTLEEKLNVTFPPGEELHTDDTNKFLQDLLKKVGVECSPPLTNARMIDKLVGEYLEDTCISPSFIMGHPEMMSPLAKYHRSRKGLVERFELFVAKKGIFSMLKSFGHFMMLTLTQSFAMPIPS